MTDIQSRLPYHFSQIAALCSEHPTVPKFLFLPSSQVGYNLLTGLSRSGVAWANVEPLSPREHVERRFEPELRARGMHRLYGDMALVVMAGLLRELKDRVDNSYFEPVGVTPSLARSVWDTLQALRMAGVKKQDLESGPIRSEKTRALAYLMGRLDEFLGDTRQYDAAFILDYAIRESAGQPVEGIAAIMDETQLTRRNLRYLQQSFGDRIVRIGRSDYGLPIPKTVAGHALDQDPLEVGRLGHAGNIRREPMGDSQISFVHVFGSRGPEAEVGDVLRRCLEHEIPLDEVEIAYSNAGVYVPLLADLADRFEVTISFAEGVPATLTRPGAGLRGFIDWISDNCPAERLAALMRAGVLSFHRAVDGVKMADMPELASHFRLAVLDEGIDRYASATASLASSREGWSSGSEGESSFQRKSRLIQQCIELLVSVVPTTERLRIDQVASLCVTFLDQLSVVHGERDERAVESLRDRFSQFGKEGGTVLPKRLALQLAADMVERHTVQASTAAAGSLHAVSIERAGYSGRNHLFIVGLDVDNFPGRSAEDPILLDIERQQLSLNLDLKSSQATDQIWHLLRALGMAPGHVYFGTSLFNAEREEALVYPSPFFQYVAKQKGVDYLAPPPISERPFHLDDAGALLPQRRRANYAAFVGARYPWMTEGGAADTARKSPVFTAYDGWLDAPDESLGYADEGTVFSPNRMEKLAACPYRYFLHYVLGIRRPDYYAPDPTRWLDPRHFGTLLHDLYHDFLRELAERDERPEVERHRDLILGMLNELVERYVSRFPPDNQAAYEYERQRLERSAMAFLQTEAEHTEPRPALFEFVFGSGDATSPALRDPVVIRLAADLSIRLRGRIDRVDVLPDDSLAIWDYKTGSSYNFDQGPLLRGGLNLQWVLYAYAMEELAPYVRLPGVVSTSGYYFASDNENGRRIAEQPPERAALYSLLAPLFDLVRRGAFLHVTKKPGECRFCDFRTVCASEVKTKKDLRDMWFPNTEQAFIAPLSEWMEEE